MGIIGNAVVLTFTALCMSLTCADAKPRGAPAVDEPAVTTCNLNTGSCTGQDAGTGLFAAAVCDGVTSVTAAFNSFNTFARATTTNTNGQLIEAVVTGPCQFGTPGAAPFRGLKKARLMAYGATFSGTGRLPNLGPADTIPGICHKALNDGSGCSARIDTVSAGATSVTINLTGYGGSLATLCSRFVAGRWAVVTGFDLQGAYNDPYGYPPNPHFLDFAQITSTANCASTGEIALSRALTYGYLSTWPNFNSGNGGEADSGGPGTIYALDQYWGGEVDLRGFTLNDLDNQSIYQGRSTKLRDVTMNGSHCIIPSQNETFEMVNSTGIDCSIEIDKLINNLVYRGTTMRRISFQSSSTNTLTWDGGSLILSLNGTPKVANVSNLTTPSIVLGPYAYGVATSATCTNCVVTNLVTGFGLVEKGGSGDPGANIFYPVSGGVFSYAIGTGTVTGLSNNGSGKVRITVPSTAGWATGGFSGIKNLFSACSAPSPCGSGSFVTVVDGTTLDLTSYNFADVTWSGGGFLSRSAEQERWAVPGTNVTASAIGGITAGVPFFQVNSVTQSGLVVNIATTLPGSYPNVPVAGDGKSNLAVQAPRWTCTNCSGSAQMVDFSGAPPSIPIFSYSNRTWACTGGPPCATTALTSYPLWGKVSSFKINVTQPYVGSTSPFRINFVDTGVNSSGAYASFSGLIDLRTAGLRTITPAGVTCDTGGGPVPGGCGSDSGLTLTDPDIMLGAVMAPSLPNGTPTDGLWSVNAEFIMNQGVVP